jgi:hypothetical protein
MENDSHKISYGTKAYIYMVLLTILVRDSPQHN